jgi:hypothetical protein
VFQLFSHKALYDDSSEDVKKSIQYAPRRSWKQVRKDRAEKKAKRAGTWVEPPAETQADVEANSAEAEEEVEAEAETPQLSVIMTIGLLVVVTVVCDLLSRVDICRTRISSCFVVCGYYCRMAGGFHRRPR